MPSDTSLRAALDALAGPVQAFRSTLARTADEVAQLLQSQAATKGAKADRFAAELGPFARGRIAIERFAQTVDVEPSVNGAAAELIRRAHTTLQGLLDRGNDLLCLTVPPGASLREAVAERLADVGRAFGAARVARDARSGAAPDRHAAALDRFPFAQWTRAERNLAPPVVIEVRGADLWAASLAEFLDGRVKMALVVAGASSPAPLARLIAPSLFVQQAAAAADLSHLVAWDGPGIAALVPEGAARFVHDPKRGVSPAARLRVEYLPTELPRKAVDGISVAQQTDELAMLAALSQAAPATAESIGGAVAPEDPAAQLAAWLLAQADLGA